ncbi:MAG TPA: VWA domain-containing protein [Thermoanaerobaculia bacterium]|nr:VWA domain-containing protein [Thermoanaerobaculia bacterium]
MRPLVGIASVSLLFAATAVAQVHETIHVNLVEVPVTVVSRAGDPVRGLKKENFELFDQRKKVAITSFDVIDFSSPDYKRASPLNPAARRSFLLLFDLSFASPVGLTKAKEAALNFIARGMQQRDLAAIGTIDVQRGFRLLTAFTTDRNILSAAVASPRSFQSSDPLQIAGTEITDLVPSSNLPVTDSSSGRFDDVAADINAEIQRGQNRLNDQFNRARIERQVNLLGGLARTLRMLPGRKEVVFFSEGFDPRLVRGRDVRASGEAMEEMSQVETGEVWKVDTDNRYGDTQSLSAVEQMARFFRGSDVVLNAVDIEGVRVQNDAQNGATINSNDGLFLLSNPTGGEVFHNSNDLSRDLDRMLRQQEVVYVLGFQAPTTKQGQFHALKVRVDGAPGARVFHRAGYYEAGAENDLERTLSNAEIVLNDIPQNDVRVAALAAPFPTTGNAQVPVILEINGDDLAAGAKSNRITADIYIYAFDDQGLVHDRIYQRLSLDLTKVGEKLRERGLKYYATLSLPAGKYSIKSLVRTIETDRKGYARTDLTVPGPDDVAVLPPFFFEAPGQWLMVKGASHDKTNSGYPFQINGEPFIPSAEVQVKNGQVRQFAVFVYNATPDEVAWETSISDASGGAHGTEPRLVRELAGQDVTKLMFQYAPEHLGQGVARLDVTVRKKGSADFRKATVPLNVE